jgi:hypothetical protein
MWISLFAIAIAASVVCCVVATMMQPTPRNSTPWEA